MHSLGVISQTDYCMSLPARRYDTSVLAVIMCLCVRPSVHPSLCLSHAGIAPKQLKVGSRKQRRAITQ